MRSATIILPLLFAKGQHIFENRLLRRQ